ncbi:hypothetical protein ABT174_32525 [Streptomyces sparsogenes]|uniref:hypothetical protein n=1 Tax=Streptomyces sparsogenes TaxID=67365 RepID=UPI0033227D88
MTTTESTNASAAYWEPLWAEGRRYRQVCEAEKRVMDEHLGPGLARPARDRLRRRRPGPPPPPWTRTPHDRRRLLPKCHPRRRC